MTIDHKPQLKPEAEPLVTAEQPSVEHKAPWFKTLAGKIAVGGAALVMAVGIGVRIGAADNNSEGRPETPATAPQNPSPEATPTEAAPTPESTETEPSTPSPDKFTHNLDLWRPADGGRLSPEQQASMSDSEITEAYRIKASEVDSDEDLVQEILYRFSEATRIGSTVQELDGFRREDGQLGIDNVDSFRTAAQEKSMVAMDGFIEKRLYSEMIFDLNGNTATVFARGRDFTKMFPDESGFDDYTVGFKLDGAIDRLNQNVFVVSIERINNYADSYAPIAAQNNPKYEMLQNWEGPSTMTITTKKVGDNIIVADYNIDDRQ